MTEGLNRKKKVRGGHRASATRIISQTYETIESTDAVESVVTKLKQSKLILQEKLETVKQLDEEILGLVDDEEVDNEIEQADVFKERVHRAIIDSTSALEAKQTVQTTTEPAVPTTTTNVPLRELPSFSTTSATTTVTPLTESPSILRTPATTTVTSLTESPSILMTPTTTTASIPLRDIPSISLIPTTVASTSASVELSSVFATGRVTKVKLPKLALKRFNGDLTKWSTFWDSFESSIHNQPDLSDIDKFNYLNTLLEGPASEAISGLKITTTNYNEAVAILRKRFGNKQQIITKHMDMLLNIDAVTSQHNLKGLRHLYDVVESQVRGLKSLGVSADTYGSLLSSVLMNKLPQELRLIISRQVREEEWTLDGIMEITEREITARERALSNSCQPSRRSMREPLTASTLFSSGSVNPKCSYCRQSHSSSSCKTVVNAAERKQILRRTGRCFICLRKNHMSRDCRSAVKCAKCNGRHHVSICSGGQNGMPETNPAPEKNASNPGQLTASSVQANQPNVHAPTSTTMYCVDAGTPVLLQTAQASVYKIDNPGKSRRVRIIFDSGSQRSYITDRVKNQLLLQPIRTETMLIKTFGAENQNNKACEVVELGVHLRNGRGLNMSFLSVPLICEPISSQPIAFATDIYKQFASLELADYSHGDKGLEVDILVGSDQYWKLVTGEVIHQHDGPTAIHTRLGWVLSGPIQGLSQQVSSVNLVSTHALMIDIYQPQEEAQGLDSQLKMFWDLEAMGIQPKEHSVYDKFEKDIVHVGDRYQVSLPWKQAYPILPDNYDLALKRLNGLLKRLRQNPKILHQYDSVIREQQRRGIVEVVDKHELEKNPTNQVHYLPHHAVLREDKSTTKLRIVYDASAKTNGPALNDCLYTGPKFGQNIMDIILRFRAHKVALAADIEKAFLMIAVSPQDRDVLRFLWIDDIKKEPPKFVVLRFTRVVFGVSSSPFLLNATIRHHMEKYSDLYPQFVRTFLRSIYVDDVSCGADNDDNAFELYLKSRHILAEGGFNLRKFVTNSGTLSRRIEQNESNFYSIEGESVNGNLEEEDKTYTKDLLGGRQGQEDDEQKILGVRWNYVIDELIFDLNELAILVNKIEPTKRQIVAVTTKFYDPLGFISPVIISFKMLFQEMCIKGIGWDEPLSGELLSKWKSLVSNFQGVTTSIPRCYFNLSERSSTTCSLQGFCDASSGAYAAVVYMKIESETGNTVNFVAAKTRVAPANKQTIPRLELLSTLLLANLINNVSMALKPEVELKEICCFTDSKVALYWIKGTNKEWKPFVENRTNEVRRLVPPQCWNHCPGKENPADLPSRGMTPIELVGSRLWRYGPDWLFYSRAIEDEEGLKMPEECLKEIKATHDTTHGFLITSRSSCLDNIIHCESFSRLQRLLRVTAYVIRFVNTLKGKVKKERVVLALELTTAEVSNAEKCWIIESQRHLKEDAAFPTWEKQFNLFLDAGVWRCGGRLSNADIPYSAKHPALLHKSHYLTLLIIRDAHERVRHNGVKETLTEIRSRYWIVRGRQLVRQVLHKCILCHRFESQPYKTPPPPPLPSFRVREAPAFTYTGVDFAGPLYIRNQGLETEGKVWICLYTCCAIRAVHLELVPNMTSEAFIRCFKRFTARRGFPHKFISDNGKTFKAAAKTIDMVLNQPEVQQFFAGIGLEWSFNLEKAPWWGGVFERMIKSVKRCLRKTIGKAKLTYDELSTALTEVEMIINSRPLSYVSTEDVEEPLTPSHLLVGRRVLSLPDTTFYHKMGDDNYNVELTHDSLSRRMDHLNKTLNHFWKRWRAEYLLQLRECHRHSGTTDSKNVLCEGQVVLMHNEGSPRGFWKLVRIHKLIKGGDGHIRGAIVRVLSKGARTTLLRRPVKCLYPLEPNCKASGTQNSTDTQDGYDEMNNVEPEEKSSICAQNDRNEASTVRPFRKAAQKANNFIRAVMSEQDSDSHDDLTVNIS